MERSLIKRLLVGFKEQGLICRAMGSVPCRRNLKSLSFATLLCRKFLASFKQKEAAQPNAKALIVIMVKS